MSDVMTALTRLALVTQDRSQKPEKGKGKAKGKKMPVRLEFEQRYMLDARRHEEITAELFDPSPAGRPVSLADFANPKVGITVCRIKQFYTDGDRFRHSGEVWGKGVAMEPAKYVKEKKRTINLNTPYSVNSEEEENVQAAEFDKGWKTANRRLQKIRFYVPSENEGNRTVVDFFYSLVDGNVYAVSAEDEVIIDNTTLHLSFDFKLPIYLRKYLICTVDSRDPAMKCFRSASMIDTPECIAEFKRAISQWYEPGSSM